MDVARNSLGIYAVHDDWMRDRNWDGTVMLQTTPGKVQVAADRIAAIWAAHALGLVPRFGVLLRA